jgi:NADH-ubiquinone oxidoreductase chain 1
MESELVSGFMTEHAAVIFVFFFLAEYASIVLICILTSILFLGGYLFNFAYIVYLIKEIDFYLYISIINSGYETFLSDPLIEGMIYGLTLGFKTCVMIFVFIWARASFPRIRYDQLMSFC